MKSFKPFSIILFLSSILFYSCESEPYIAEGNYINPPKDTVSFGYRLRYMFFEDVNKNVTTFDFLLDTGIGYRWTEVNIKYKNENKKYLVEYTSSGYIERLFDYSAEGENIEIEYANVSPMYSNLITVIRYYRKLNPFALEFKYNGAGDLISLKKRFLYDTGTLGVVQESQEFCPNVNLGDCADTILNQSYAYSADFNNLFHCNELAPFLLLLSKPKQSSLSDISAELPYYFSRKLPTNTLSNAFGIYEYAISAKELVYIKYRTQNSSNFEQYDFTKRLN